MAVHHAACIVKYLRETKNPRATPAKAVEMEFRGFFGPEYSVKFVARLQKLLPVPISILSFEHWFLEEFPEKVPLHAVHEDPALPTGTSHGSDPNLPAGPSPGETRRGREVITLVNVQSPSLNTRSKRPAPDSPSSPSRSKRQRLGAEE